MNSRWRNEWVSVKRWYGYVRTTIFVHWSNGIDVLVV